MQLLLGESRFYNLIATKMCVRTPQFLHRGGIQRIFGSTGKKMEVVIWFLITNIVIRIPLEDLTHRDPSTSQ